MKDLVIANTNIRRDAEGRYSLNDLHRASGGEQKDRPKYWSDTDQSKRLVRAVESKGGIPPLEVIHGGADRGTYGVEQLVVAYAAWISPEFHLEVINTFLAAKQSNVRALPSFVEDGCVLIESANRTLRLSNSATLGMYQRLGAKSGHADILPVYAIDGESSGSSDSTSSLTALLKEHGIPMTARSAYPVLEVFGIVEHKARTSRRGAKKFWCVAEKGLRYGKNVTHPDNPRETQPHFYDSRFQELIDLVGLDQASAA